MRRRAAVISWAVEANVLGMEAIEMEVRQTSTAARMLTARVQVALLHIPVHDVVVLRVNGLAIERHAHGSAIRQAHPGGLLGGIRVGEGICHNPAPISSLKTGR
jgi:hypothetical protein